MKGVGGVIRLSVGKRCVGAICIVLAMWIMGATIHHRTRAASAPSGIPVPVLMYHSLLKDTSRTGTYVVTPDQFESDMRWLQDHGYTTVHMADLIAYVQNGTPLPDKPVVITFDDGYYNNYVYAYPILQRLGMKGVLSVIGRYTDLYSGVDENNAYYSHCTWDQLKEMQDSGVMEIQNHTFDLHTYTISRHGCASNRGEPPAQYRQVVGEDILKLQNHIRTHLGTTPTTMVYPFGSYTAASEALIRELGFSASLSCETGIAFVEDAESLYCMKRILRPGAGSAGDFFAAAGL